MSDINITDNPISNYDMLCNFCRYVDGRAKFMRTETGDDTDIYDFCRNKCSEKCGVDFPEKDGGFMMEKMCFDCSETDCLIYLLYITAVQAAELREHIKNHNSDNGEPVCHGNWIYSDFCTKCSVCGKSAFYDKYKQECETDYCPNCGAKMDGKERKEEMLDTQRLTVGHETIDGYTLKNICSWGMDGEPTDESGCTEICALCDGNCDDCPIQQAINRLAEYENTGLSPEEINAMKEREENA